MIGRWAIVATCAAGCGRIAFESRADGSDSGGGPAMFDRDFTRSEFADLTLQRASVATYVDASGLLRRASPNQPRFDVDYVTGEGVGLLIEESRTNLITGSESLDIVPWFNNGAANVVIDQAVAPDGTLTADEVFDNDTTGNCRWAQGLTVGDDTARYSYSVFVKAGTRSTMTFASELIMGLPTVQTHMTVNLANGMITTTPAGTAVWWGLEPWPNGWYRVWMTLENNGSGNTNALLSVWSDYDNVPATGSVYAWGAQIERGDRPSSYIPTTTPTIRDADIVTSGASWLAADRGTLRTSASFHGVLERDLPVVCLIADATRRTCIERDEGAGKSAITTTDAEVLGGNWGFDETRIVVGAWQPGELALWDGTLATIPASLPAPASRVGFGYDGTDSLHGHLKRVTYWPDRLSDAELSALGASP